MVGELLIDRLEIMNVPEKNTAFVKSLAARYGFEYCGIARAERLDTDARRLESWLNKGMHGKMQYMENHFDLRVDPARLVPGARSVITLLMNYSPAVAQVEEAPRIARYAFGEDYHLVIREKLTGMLDEVRTGIGEVHGRGFVDSAPVLERSWGQKTGLGWIGKNGNLINKQSGSYFFIATLITDLELCYDDPFAGDFCGTCTRCIDNCPTEAILPDKVVDGSKCISYFTIELKDALIPGSMKEKFGNWMFGCDVCQEVCPWNRFSKPTTETRFTPIPAVLNFTTNDWEDLTEEQFKVIFRNSPIKRSKFSGIKRNLHFIRPTSEHPANP
jgi:epoxyqueuosine reductase